LLVSDEVVGTLTLVAAEAGFFDDEEVKLLTDLAGDIAFAIDHIEKKEKLDYLVLYDQLTGLANRALFVERLNQTIHAAGQTEGKFALAILDIERLSTINESLGQHAGDALLKLVGECLKIVGGASGVSRLSADHFALIVGAVKERSQAGRIVNDALQKCFGESFRVSDTELRISAKAGVALYPGDGEDAETLLRNAEAALRKAKRLGERHVLYTSALHEGTAGQLTLENRLRQALEKDEFVLHYQPKVDVETRRIVGVEALIRWQSSDLGLVPPMKFIPLMEQTGLILEVGAWALRRAAADHRSWVEQRLQAPRVAVNVSAIQLRQREFVGAVEQAIIEGVAPTGIDLEITESLIMEDIEGNIQKLKEVRGLGLGIAIDDFGTGYSSLGYLAKLPVHALKIDRSFIITMISDPGTMTLVQTIISLAHSLRLRVIAEGVDDEEQARFLRLLRCDEMQGYLFSKPLPLEQMTALLEAKA
jgi:diguanylate cyclase (GGDEF)-like protein